MIRQLSLVSAAAAIMAAVSFYAFGQNAPGFFSAHQFYAGPISGGAAYPTPRVLDNTDVNQIQVPANTTKCNNAGSTAVLKDCTTAQMLTMLGLTGISYSQGTWTPTLLGTGTAGTPTYTNQTGTYEVVGRQVVVRFNLQVSALGGPTGFMLVGGLPFASGGSGTDFGACVFNYASGITLDTGYTQFVADIQPGVSQISLQELGSGVAGTNLAVGKFTAPVQIIAMCNYHT